MISTHYAVFHKHCPTAEDLKCVVTEHVIIKFINYW